MNPSDPNTKTVTKTSNQEPEQKPCPAYQLITDRTVEEQNNEIEKVFTGIYRCLLSDPTEDKKTRKKKRRRP